MGAYVCCGAKVMLHGFCEGCLAPMDGPQVLAAINYDVQRYVASRSFAHAPWGGGPREFFLFPRAEVVPRQTKCPRSGIRSAGRGRA